jgi:glutathione S-transferase
MLTLYFAPGSSSMAPHIALHETGLPFEAHPISFSRKEQRSPDFLRLNPARKVPLLLVDDRPLTEVAGILTYIAKAAPTAGLWPEGNIEAEAQVVSWMSFIASALHPARTQGLEHVRRVYAIADGRLGRKDWVVGRYSVADIHLFRLFWRMRNSLRPQAGAFPALEAHYDRMMERAAVQRTIETETEIGYELPA